jgi:hypothetical protein
VYVRGKSPDDKVELKTDVMLSGIVSVLLVSFVGTLVEAELSLLSVVLELVKESLFIPYREDKHLM